MYMYTAAKHMNTSIRCYSHGCNDHIQGSAQTDLSGGFSGATHYRKAIKVNLRVV